MCFAFCVVALAIVQMAHHAAEFSIARVTIPDNGYTRSRRRHEMPLPALVDDYVEYLVSLPAAQRSPHLQAMVFSRPRLAAEATIILGNARWAFDQRVHRYQIRDQTWATDVWNRVVTCIAQGGVPRMDSQGRVWPPDFVGPRPAPPNPLP